MRLHLFRPAVAERYPGILLYSEIYQIAGPIRRIAAFLVGPGYLVPAPEVCHEFEKPGAVLAYDAAGTDRGNELKFTMELSAFDSGSERAQQRADLAERQHAAGHRAGAAGGCQPGRSRTAECRATTSPLRSAWRRPAPSPR